MKQITAIIVVVLVVCATIGATYLFASAIKDQEILEQKVRYETDISNLRQQNENLTSKLSESCGDYDKFIGTWNYTNGTLQLGDPWEGYIIFYSNGVIYQGISGWQHCWDITRSSCSPRLIIGGMYSEDRIYEFSFSDNYTVLTLIEAESGGTGIYTKYLGE